MRRLLFLLLLPTLLWGGLSDTVKTEMTWWDRDWNNRISLKFMNEFLSDTLDSIPVLVKLYDGRIDYSDFKLGGADIRFIDTDNKTELKYEIEEWDAGGTSYVWVRVLDILKSGEADSMWLYYKNPGAVDNQDTNGVWNSDYVGVWHLHDDFKDHTMSGYNGTNNGTVDAVCRIGDGQQFSGDSNYIDCGDVSELNSVSSFTISFWMNEDVLDQSDNIIYKFKDSFNRINISPWGNGYFNFTICNGSASYGYFDYSTVMSAGSWYYVTVVYDGGGVGNAGRLKVYIDGVNRVLIYSGTIPAVTPDLSGIDFTIGNGSNSFDGKLDEVRISSVSRSAECVKAQYRSMIDSLIDWDVSIPECLSGQAINADVLLNDISADQTATISMMVQCVDMGVTVYFFTIGDTDGNTAIRCLKSAADIIWIQVWVQGAYKWSVRLTDAIPAGIYHIVFIHDGSAGYIYVNGTLPTQTYGSEVDKTYWVGDGGGVFDNVRVACINFDGAGNTGFSNNILWDVRYYTGVATPAQDKEMYEMQGNPTNKTFAGLTCKLYYKMAHGGAGTVPASVIDYSGYANHGTPIGSPYFIDCPVRTIINME